MRSLPLFFFSREEASFSLTGPDWIEMIPSSFSLGEDLSLFSVGMTLLSQLRIGGVNFDEVDCRTPR